MKEFYDFSVTEKAHFPNEKIFLLKNVTLS